MKRSSSDTFLGPSFHPTICSLSDRRYTVRRDIASSIRLVSGGVATSGTLNIKVCYATIGFHGSEGESLVCGRMVNELAAFRPG